MNIEGHSVCYKASLMHDAIDHTWHPQTTQEPFGIALPTSEVYL